MDRNDIVKEFVDRYRREYDFYDHAARMVLQELEARLRAAGVKAMVTSRAKSIESLEMKLRDRAPRKRYSTLNDIYDDIPDLAGVRVALYFPAQVGQVEQIINDAFLVLKRKQFPMPPAQESGMPATYRKRFSGYSAVHYRVRLREAPLQEPIKRYAEARVEIQVASVLMHAWAEVEHDLVYKPHQGELSEDEHAILDELNGTVLAGEIALERLQRAGEARIASKDRPFENHYELAAWILRELRGAVDPNALQAGLGHVDWLYALLTEAKAATPESASIYLPALHYDLERRPVAEQVIDQMLAEHEDLYEKYRHIRALPGPDEELKADKQAAVGEFLQAWNKLERILREYYQLDRTRFAPWNNRRGLPGVRALQSLGGIDEDTLSNFERLRRVRNNLVHGTEVPDPSDLREAQKAVELVCSTLSSRINAAQQGS